MPSRREQVLAAILQRLRAALSAKVRRNEALPVRVPPEGLIILRDGDPGKPDVTLNPRTEFYSHRVELEALVTRPVDGSGEEAIDGLLQEVATTLAVDLSLDGHAENLRLGPPEIGALTIEGAAPILTARLTVTVDYLVSDPLAA